QHHTIETISEERRDNRKAVCADLVTVAHHVLGRRSSRVWIEPSGELTQRPRKYSTSACRSSDEGAVADPPEVAAGPSIAAPAASRVAALRLCPTIGALPTIPTKICRRPLQSSRQLSIIVQSRTQGQL